MRQLIAFLACSLCSIALAGTGNYTSVVAGTAASGTGGITPGMPAGVIANTTPLILIVGARAATDTQPSDPSGWTLLLDTSSTTNDSLAIWCRIYQSGDAIPSVDFTGTSNTRGIALALFGNVPTTCTGIVAASGIAGSSSNTANIPNTSVTVPENNVLLLGVGKKSKTVTADGATITSPTGLTGARAWTQWNNGTDVGFIADYTIQTTATNFTSSAWTQSIAESAPYGSLVLALKSGDLTPPTFSVSPAIGTRTTSTIPVTATTACTDCNYYGVAVVDGSGAPTCTQVKAGQNSGGTAAYKAFGPVAMTTTVQNTGTFSTYTDGTLRDGYFCLNSTVNGDSTVASIADMYKIPAFSVTPSISAQSDVAYTITKTLDGAGTVYAVACKKDATAPSVTDVEAAHCASASSPQASSNDDATGTFALGSALTFPVYDIYVVGTYGSQHEAAVHTLADECLDAPSGKQVINCPSGLTSIGTGSPIDTLNASITPDIAAGDIPTCDSVTTPGSFAATIGLDGNISYSGDSSRQYLNCTFYDLSVGGIHADDLDFWANNLPPIPPEPNSLTFFVPLNSAMTPVDLTPYCTDPEGDAITVTNVDSLPTGLSISSSTLQGTATVRAKTLNIQLKCTDITGDSVTWQ
jgi:hypothetical protein